MRLKLLLLIQAIYTLLVLCEPRKPAIQLAFGVMTYQKPGVSVDDTFAEFMRLMVNIYEGSHKHVYVLHTDVKSEPALLDAINEGYCKPKSNCRSITSRNVAWGSITTAEMMLALMQEADQFYGSPFAHKATANPLPDAASWDYFILLGHESFPLTTLTYTEQYLADRQPGSNFINCWPVAGYDFFGQWEGNTWRLEGVVVDDFAGKLMDADKMRREPPTFTTFYKSLQHVVLSRDFTRHAVYGPDTRLTLLFLANVRTSDEMVLPTLLMNSAEFAPTAQCNYTLHYSHWIRPGGSWHPEYLTIEHLPLLLNIAGSTALYARKMNLYMSDVLIWAVDRIKKEALDKYRSASKPLLPTLALAAASASSATPVTVIGVTAVEVEEGSSPSPSPSLESPDPYLTSLDWLVPAALKHIQTVSGDPATHPRIRHTIRCTRILEIAEATPVIALLALDAIRTVRDRVESDSFLKLVGEKTLPVTSLEQCEEVSSVSVPPAVPSPAAPSSPTGRRPSTATFGTRKGLEVASAIRNHGNVFNYQHVLQKHR